MDHYDVKRFGLILSIQAQIDGMKAENTKYAANQPGVMYDEADFQAKAEELENMSYCHNEQL